MKILKTILILLISIILNCRPKESINFCYEIKDGILDLTKPRIENPKCMDSDFQFKYSIPLKGNWGFSWNEFSESIFENSKDFKDSRELQYEFKKTNENKFLYIPGFWDEYKYNGRSVGGQGYGSYKLLILLPEDRTILPKEFGIKVFDLGTNYKFFLNGKLIYEVGKIGKNKDDSIPAYIPKFYLFPETTEKVYELIFQVSNFHNFRGGMWLTPIIGNKDELEKKRDINNFIDTFISGASFLFGIYHIGVFFLRREQRSSFYFGIFCILLSIRPILINEDLFFSLDFSNIWIIGLKLKYLSFYMGTPIVLLFVYETYPKEVNKIILYFVVISTSILCSIVIIFPPLIFTQTLNLMYLFIFLTLLLIILTLIKATYKKYIGALEFMIGFGVFSIAILNDILFDLQLITTEYLSHIGFLFFIFSQSIFILHEFIRTLQKIEELSSRLEEKVVIRTKELEEEKIIAQKERDKSEKLLLNILPKEIAYELKDKGYSEPIYFNDVSVLFTDFKGFTKIAENMSPSELVKELDLCFIQFDKIIEKYNLEKLKTIGDSYMCAGGIPKINKTHPIDTVLAALEIQNFMNFMKEEKEKLNSPYWEIRLGIHTGPLIAGVIGEKKFAYDVWGDTVNTASRMESSGSPGMINISGDTYNSIKDFFDCTYRGKVNAKNKGDIDMYYVHGLKSKYYNESKKSSPSELFNLDYQNLKNIQ
jgi:class 3 adenylate cyclase